MRPTRRFWAFLIIAFVFWFFANQTQIGWLYIVSALLGGILIAAWVLNRGTIKQVTGTRNLNLALDDVRHEADDITITLILNNTGQMPASHLALIETCPLAPPDSEQHDLALFIPMVSDQIQFDYQTTIHRRGLHHFPAMQLMSRAPFGFFERKGTHAIETSLLVYPELRPLGRLSLLDEQAAAELTNPKAGMGSEVIGVRPYRAGDSPRHIHWRSVARRGQLVSKEFAQETQPGVSIVIDRYCPLSPLPETKHQPFEIAIKCAVSIADYAMKKGYPVHLAAHQDDLATPRGAIISDILMQYTAHLIPTSEPTLADVLSYQPMQQFVAIIMAWVDDTIIETLLGMQHRGYKLLVIIPDPTTFPIDSDVSASGLQSTLAQNNIDYRIIKHGDDWADVISHEVEI
ncbi:MAG: DUF58 domain-containing protein [Phototrophicaceae bacterium]